MSDWAINKDGYYLGPFPSEADAQGYMEQHEVSGHIILMTPPIGPSPYSGETPVPRAVQQTVCSECRLPWKTHQNRAERLWWDHIPVDSDVEPPEVYPVTHAVCVSLLLERDRGPMGPAGPQGQHGLNGRNYWEGMP